MERMGLLICLLCPLWCMAQRVQMEVGGSFSDMERKQTRTVMKPGWKIIDIQLKPKCIRYLWGGQSHQLAENSRPVFLIEPGQGETLAKYALVALKKRKSHRRMKKPVLTENACIRVEPAFFEIRSDKHEGFIVQPRTALAPGEYMLVNMEQSPCNADGDYSVYPFQVPSFN